MTGVIGRVIGGAVSGGVSGVIDAATRAGRTFLGDRARSDEQQHETMLAVLAQAAAEGAARGRPPTWLDSAVDGLNRLPRPALAFATMGLFAFAMAEPAGFAERMRALDLVPESLWWLLGSIVTFYFGARELHHIRRDRSALVAAALSDIERLQARRRQATPMAESAYRREMADGDRPLSDAAIAEWNRRNGNGSVAAPSGHGR